jgi:hypothetical protein
MSEMWWTQNTATDDQRSLVRALNSGVAKWEEGEWSDENIRRWAEKDKLGPTLAEWLKRQRGDA